MQLKEAMILACKKYNYGMERFHLQNGAARNAPPGHADPPRKNKREITRSE
jgi:hypothetical protein